MKVYEGTLRITPSFVHLVMDEGEVTLPIVLRNGEFVRYSHSGAVSDVRVYFDYPEEGVFLYFPEYKKEREVFVKVVDLETDIKPRALKDRETLKAFETPDRTVELFIRDWLERLKSALEEVLEKRKEKALLERIRQVPIEELYQHIRDHWDEYKKALGELLEVPPRLVFFDPQAGSGEAFFKSAEKYGIKDAVLLGVELRDVQSQREGYAVQTGVDYLAYYSELYRRLSLRELTGNQVFLDPTSKRDEQLVKLAHEHKVHFTELVRAYALTPRIINPPYIAQGRHPLIWSTFANEPPLMRRGGKPYSGYAYVVLSHAHESVFRNYYHFVEKQELSYQEVGYSNPVPEKYVVGLVVNNQNNRNVLSDNYDFLEMVNLVSKSADALKRMVEVIADDARKVMKKIRESDLRDLVADLSVEEDARRNEAVFPALDQIGKDGLGFYTYEEVINNPILVDFYRQKTPHLYQLIKTMAEERGDVVREFKKREYAIMDERGLGILKYAGLPLIYPLDDKVKGAILNLLPEEEKEKFLKLLQGLQGRLEIWLKSGEGVVAYEDGLVGFGRQTHVCLCDPDSRVHAILPVDPLDFLKAVNEIKVNTYEKDKGFLPFVKEIVKQYALYSIEGARLVFTEDELKTIDQRSWGNDESAFSEFCNNLYIDQRLEGRFIKDRLFKDQFFFLLRQGLLSRLRSVGEERTEEVEALVDAMEKAYKEDFVCFFANFNEVLVEDFAKKHTNGKSLVDWLEDNISVMKISEDAKGELKAELYSSLKAYSVRVLEEDPVIMRRAIAQYLTAQDLLKAIEIIEREVAKNPQKEEKLLRILYQHFRNHLERDLGFFDYQVDFALNSAYSDRNVLLGWQQRTGKTRAALLSLVFQSFTRKTTADFFVRSQNLLDILGQYIDALPLLSGFVKVGMGQTRRENSPLSEKLLITHPHPEFVYPNPFYNTRKGQIFKRGGTAVKELLERGAYARIERYIREPDQELLKHAKGKIYERLLYVKGYEKSALEGVVCYLAELDRAGELDLKNGKVWQAWFDVVEREGERLQEDKELLSNKRPLINILSREVFYPSINALVLESKKSIDKNVFVNIDTDKKSFKGYSSEYYFLSPALVEEIKKRRPELLKEKCVFAGMLAGSEVYITKDQKAIEDFMSEEALYSSRYKVENLRELLYALMVNTKNLFTYGFDYYSNPNGYLILPEKAPYYTKLEKTEYVYGPAEDEGFKETYIQVKNRKVYVEYRYEQTERNRIYSSSESSARPVMISLGAFEARPTGHDEMDGGIGQQEDLRQNQQVLTSLARVGKVLQLSGTADPFGYLIMGMEMDKVFYYKNLVEGMVNMKEVKEEFNGFFEHLVRFIHLLNLRGEKREIENLISMLADREKKATDKIEELLESFERYGFYQPHMQTAFDAVMYVLSKDSKDNPKSVLIKRFFNALAEEKEQLQSYTHLSLINALERAMDKAELTSKTISRDFVTIANLALSDRHEATLGNRKSFRGDEGTKLLLKEAHLGKVLTEYKNSKIWPVRDAEIGGFKVRGDKNVVGFVWTEKPSSIREGFDLINKEIFKFKHLYEDYKKIVEEFFKLYAKRNIPGIHNSSKTKDDNLKDLVLFYIRNKKLPTDDEVKQRLFEEFVDALRNMKVSYTRDEEGHGFYELSITFKGITETITFPESVFYEPIDLDSYELLYSLDFNLELNLSEGRDWYPEFFKDKNTELWVKFNPLFDDFEPVVDAVSNASLVKEYENTTRQSINTFITTDRVPTLMVVLGDLLKAAYENKQGRVHILVLETDNRIKEFLSRIDIDFLASKGIYVERVFSSSELTVKAEKLVQGGDRQVYVVANTTAVARGTDLSMLDQMILAGRVVGNEGLQVLSRLEHAAKKGIKRIFLGVDGAHKYYTFKNHIKPIPNRTLITNVNTVNRKYQEEVKHTGEPVYERNKGVIIALSKPAQEILENRQKMVIGL